MAKSYVITIVDETVGSGRSATASSATGETHEQAKAKSKSDAMKAGVNLAAYNYAKQTLNTVAGYAIGTIELRTGSAKAQQEAEFAMQCITSVYNIGESILAGALMGGAVGAVAGAVVGTISKVTNIAVSQGKMDLAQSVENITLAQNAIRIGAGMGRIGDVK